MADRPPKDAYYLSIARAVAERATCSRAKHGAVAVVDDVIAATGFNGAPRGTRHCDHGPVSLRHSDDLPIGVSAEGQFLTQGDMENGHCARAVHAEANVVLNAARVGARLLGGTVYVTGTPCYRCAPLLVQAGIRRVVYGSHYRPDDRVFDLFLEADVEIIHLEA